MRNPSSSPCSSMISTATSTSISKTPCCSGKVWIKRGPWTPEEDEILSNYVKKEGEGRWRTIPKRAGLQRCGKSCRLRWVNYLRPSLKKGQIAPDEEDLILRLHRLLGNRWALIAGRIPGRTDNEIKNYWNTHLSKKLITQGIDPRTHKPLNPNFMINSSSSSSSPKSTPTPPVHNNNLPKTLNPSKPSPQPTNNYPNSSSTLEVTNNCAPTKLPLAQELATCNVPTAINHQIVHHNQHLSYPVPEGGADTWQNNLEGLIMMAGSQATHDRMISTNVDNSYSGDMFSSFLDAFMDDVSLYTNQLHRINHAAILSPLSPIVTSSAVNPSNGVWGNEIRSGMELMGDQQSSVYDNYISSNMTYV